MITVDIDPTAYELDEAIIWKWITDAARGVTMYYGRFPVDHCHLEITASSGHGVQWGQASGKTKIPTVSVDLGRHATAEDLAEDWTLTHEIVHVAFPNMARTHLWIEEGLATYIEPIARFKVGLRTEQSVWYEWMVSMPQGQPKEGDAGLDHTRTWGRVYWGGALFALVSDVEIRRQTKNRRGLRHALRGIVDAGGDMKSWWTISKALTAADEATQTNVLMTQYEKRRAAPEPVDLEALWKNLGVRVEPGKVVLDDTAPWADIRRSILRD